MCTFRHIMRFDRQIKMSNMNMSIHAFSSLDLFSCAKVVSQDNIETLPRTSDILKTRLTAERFHHEDIQKQLIHMGSDPTNSYLCTWRPRFCLDIFLYFPKDANIIVGLPMYGPVINGEIVVDIEYNHTQSLNSSN